MGVGLKVGKPIHGLLTLCLLLPWTLKAEKSVRANLAEQLAQFGYQQIELRRTAENHLYLSGKLNGRRRSVLVDTGWSFTTVSTNVARKLTTLRAGNTGELSTVSIDVLKLGRISIPNQLARVEHMVFNGQPASFEVVLGCDFLRQHFAIIDCQNQRLYVRKGALPEQEQIRLDTALRQYGYNAVPLETKEPLAITCPARVNDQPVEMLVDTGAVWSVLDVRQLDRLGLRALPTLTKVSGAGRTGTRGVAMAEAKTFALGAEPMPETAFALMDLGDWGLAAPGRPLREVQGILGGPELLAGGALIDCQQLKLWVRQKRVLK